MNLTAIIAALNEEEFIEACLLAMYPFVRRIIVVTNYDTDYYARRWPPDSTAKRVLEFPDPERKVLLLVNRNLPDETIQRNWAMQADLDLCRAGRRRFRPHASDLAEIRASLEEPDWFWVVDADEIYDPETVPAALEFLAKTRDDAVLVRGYTFFKKWNFMIDPRADYFCHIGFVRPRRWFHSRRNLYSPRALAWLCRIHEPVATRLIDRYCRQTRLSPDTAHFYHGAWVGGDERIRAKVLKSSHYPELAAEFDQWFEDTWKSWTPHSRDFFLPRNPKLWPSVDYVPTERLPKSISSASWPAGWLDP